MTSPAPAFVLRVGLTGGIASGKSTVARALAEQGATVLDADALAHRLVEPGGAAYAAVAREFGEALRPDGAVDRARLGRIVFADAARRARLEAILHPLIRAEEAASIDRIAAAGHPGIVVVNAALLVETGFWRDYHRLVVVHCPPEVQAERIVRRDHLSPEEARARIAAQMPVAEKVKVAHYAIDTSGTIEETDARAREVYLRLQHDLEALSFKA